MTLNASQASRHLSSAALLRLTYTSSKQTYDTSQLEHTDHHKGVNIQNTWVERLWPLW